MYVAIVKWGQFSYSFPIDWEPSEKGYSVGKLRLTRGKWRVRFARMIVICCILDCVAWLRLVLGDDNILMEIISLAKYSPRV